MDESKKADPEFAARQALADQRLREHYDQMVPPSLRGHIDGLVDRMLRGVFTGDPVLDEKLRVSVAGMEREYARYQVFQMMLGPTTGHWCRGCRQ